MSRVWTRVVWAAAAMALLAAPVDADLVTSTAAMPAPSAVIDFSEFTDTDCNDGPGPVQIGASAGEDVEWTSTALSACLGNGTYGLTSNGQWNSGRSGFSGVNSSNDSMTYRFNDGPVTAAGGLLNYSPDESPPDVVIEALDATDTVLESYVIPLAAPISTGGANQGAFRGIVRATADIAALRLRNQYVVLDNLRFSRSTQVSSLPWVVMTGLTLLLTLAGAREVRRRTTDEARPGSSRRIGPHAQ